MLSNTQLLDLKEKEIIEQMARAICDEWGYLWDCDDPEDGQCCGDDAELYDERPSKKLFRRAATKAYACTSTLVDEIVELRKDKERLDCAQALLFACDFHWGKDEDDDGQPAVLLEIPNGVRVGANFRAFLDAALQAGGKNDG